MDSAIWVAIINGIFLVIGALVVHRSNAKVRADVGAVKSDVSEVKNNVAIVEKATNSLTHRLEAAALAQGLAEGNLTGRLEQTAEIAAKA